MCKLTDLFVKKIGPQPRKKADVQFSVCPQRSVIAFSLLVGTLI
ncbi:hypothetical protein P343_01035 [Sporolactobacillus laevolacticus DSM 442]|uniref:Uncharacterized protein n=1 Tax=Sporolactobacillus laevolacticus DSM 442 TaxID=1395513 RepID=V6J1K6_9BACL|nr:hypothetical protein P343_01035 [Sporolactobacillus laevolacticus DSM 442]